MSAGGSSSSARTAAIGGSSEDATLARSRAGRPIVGTASVRPLSNDFISFPFYGPWGSWYPWYSGFGGFGFLSYSPWRYGATRWYWSPYGLWYDPYTYDWDPYYGGGSYSSSYREREPKEEETSGTLRIKANLGAAKIYVDNALVGTVDEFDGLTGHLEIDGGRHTIELRADGYVTFKQEINVKVGKTQTIRATLKEKK